MSVDQKVAAPRRLGTGRASGTSSLVGAVLVVAVATFLVHVFATLNGYFGQDDFILTYRAAHAAPYDLGFLFQDYSGHLQPGAFLLAWAVTAVAPLNHVVAVLPLFAMHAVTLWLCWRVLVRLFGARWAILPAFTVFAASPVILFPTLWWAYGMQLFPLLLAMFGALHAHLRYLDEGRVRHAVAAVAWTLFGLAFYEKAALIPAVLFGATVLLAPRPEIAPILGALRRHRWVWVAHGVLVAAFALLYLNLTESQAGGDPVTSRTIVEFAWQSIVDTLLPGMFGGPLTDPGGGAAWQTPPPVVRMVAVLVAVAVVVVSAVRWRRRAVLPWLFLAAYLAVDLTLVAATRLGVVGPAVATDPRYVADVVPVAVLCAMFAFFPSGEPHGPGQHATELPQTRPAVLAATVLVLAGATVSLLRVAPALQFQQARDYVDTARTALADRPGIVLFDGGVPGDIMIGWFIDDAVTSRVVGLVPEEPRFDQPAEQIYRLDDKGRPRPVENLKTTVTAVPGPVKDCGYLVEDGVVRVPLHRAVPGRQIVRIGYYTADEGPGTVRVGGVSHQVRFTDGLHVMNVVATGPLMEVQVGRSQDVAPLCVTNVEVGVP
ncbi:MAG TPA: hypothetical protein VGP26_02880 [Actinophytocola sp.]|nr:hypothetical protein [Actinophytocola sp.]